MSWFEREAAQRGLKEKTISAMKDEDFDTIDALRGLTLDDMEYMKITRAQQNVLKDWVEDLKSGNTSTGVEAEAKVSLKTPSAEISLGIDANTEMEVEDYVKKYGVKNLDNFLSNTLLKHTRMSINIAVTGQSGAGKSSFINCVRNLYGDDPGSADVGVKETTMTVKPYPDPACPNIVYWDLPGIGTEKFPRHSYLEQVDFFKYDFFLILSSERFKEDDLYLAKTVHEKGKQFYFIRTKIDADISNDRRARPRQHNANELIDQVRNDCVKNLSEAQLPASNIFIISSHLEDKAKYDFPILMDTIIRNAPAQKKASLILSLNACSEKGIEAKREELEKRIPAVARLASMDERLAMTQNDRIIEEIHFYKKQFGLTDEDILKMGVNRRTLKQRTIDVLGPTGNVLLELARGIISIKALPVRLIQNLTGLQKKNESKIALILLEALKRCEEAAREVLRARQGEILTPTEAEVEIQLPEPEVAAAASPEPKQQGFNLRGLIPGMRPRDRSKSPANRK